MYKIALLPLILLLACQPTKEDLQKKYRQAYKIQMQSVQSTTRVEAKINQIKYQIGELAKEGFQNPIMLEVMTRFTEVEKRYGDWKNQRVELPGYTSNPDADNEDLSVQKAIEIQNQRLKDINDILTELEAVYALTDL